MEDAQSSVALKYLDYVGTRRLRDPAGPTSVGEKATPLYLAG
jgi:hypothetical protein